MANVKISELVSGSPASSLDGSEGMEVNQSGSKGALLSQVRQYVLETSDTGLVYGSGTGFTTDPAIARTASGQLKLGGSGAASGYIEVSDSTNSLATTIAPGEIATGTFTAGAVVKMNGLPTSDPGVAGQLYVLAGALMVSSG